MKLLVVCICLGWGMAMPQGGMPDNPSEDDMMDYLREFGYYGEDSPFASIMDSMTHEEAVSMALMELQAMGGIPQTGKMDKETVKLMKLSRCGVKDKNFKHDSAKRKRRYSLQGSMWDKNELSWTISQYTPDLTREQVDTEVVRAFDLWSSVADLKFTRKDSGRVDIDIRFVYYDHGDGASFDGNGGVLAHAFFPQFGGDTHMDDSETWTINTYEGTNLFQVIAHEFGHSLGLEHSAIQSALMAPYYRGYIPNFALDNDDIQGIQAIYGARRDMTIPPTPAPLPPRTEPPVTTTMPPVDPEMIPMPCMDRRVDAIVQLKSNEVYAFYADYYMKLDSRGIMPGYPQKISDGWQGLPNDLDAGVVLPQVFGYVYDRNSRRYYRDEILSERLYFFKGSYCYLYAEGSRQMESGYPKLIAEEFPGLPDDIDGGFVWGRNGRTYFFKDSAYYRYTHGRITTENGVYVQQPGSVDRSYPRDLSVWEGVPSNIDAATIYNGYTYFFAGHQYYRFNDYYLTVYSGYPRDVAGAWFGCSSNLEGGQTTTMMMEADMPDVTVFKVMETAGGNDTDQFTSAENKLLSSVLLLAVSLLANCI